MVAGRVRQLGCWLGLAGLEECREGKGGWLNPPPWRGFVVGLLSGLFSITVWSWPSIPYEPLAGMTALRSVMVFFFLPQIMLLSDYKLQLYQKQQDHWNDARSLSAEIWRKHMKTQVKLCITYTYYLAPVLLNICNEQKKKVHHFPN